MTLCSSGMGTCTSVWSFVSREILRTLTRLEKSRYVSGESSQDLPSPLSKMPVGQAQEVPLGRGKHRWVQPPFLLPHLLKPDETRDSGIDVKRQRCTHNKTEAPNYWILHFPICNTDTFAVLCLDSPRGLSLSTAWISIRPGRLARTVMVLAPVFLSALWMLRLCQSVQ